MIFKTGYLYFINPCRAAIPVKPKFAICISVSNSLFYLVNSCDDKRPYKHEEGNIVFIEKAKLKSLSHRSYINVTKPCVIGSGDFSFVSEKEYIANDLWIKIKEAALSNRKLSIKYKKMIDRIRF